MSKDQSLKSVVSIKLGSCVTGPTKAMLRDLAEVAYQCDCVRTMAEAWIMDTIARSLDVRVKELSGLARIKERDRLVIEGKLAEYVKLKYLYKPEMVTAFSALSSSLVAACCRDALQRLTSKMPWPIRRAKFRWQGILLGECQRDVWSSPRVPIMAGKNRVSKITHRHVNGAYVLDFPLWSKQSGRKNLRAGCRLEVMQHGKASIVRAVVANPDLFRDSELVQREKRDYDSKSKRWVTRKLWLLQLTYTTPNHPPKHQENVVDLVLASPLKDYPFDLLREGVRPWRIGGHGRFVAYQEDYAWRKSKALGLRYSDASRESETHGHGRGQAYRKLRPGKRAARDARLRFRREIIADVVKYCQRNGIGKLIYHEPGTRWRGDGSWFGRNAIPFDWSTFEPQLRSKLASIGVECETVREKLADHCERWSVDSKAVFARKTERITDTGVESIKLREGEGVSGPQAAPLANSYAIRVSPSGCDSDDASEE